MCDVGGNEIRTKPTKGADINGLCASLPVLIVHFDQKNRAKDDLLTFVAASKLFKLQNRSDNSEKNIAQVTLSGIKTIAYLCHDVVKIVESDEDTVGSSKHTTVTSDTTYLKIVRNNNGVSVTSMEEDWVTRPRCNSDLKNCG